MCPHAILALLWAQGCPSPSPGGALSWSTRGRHSSKYRCGERKVVDLLDVVSACYSPHGRGPRSHRVAPWNWEFHGSKIFPNRRYPWLRLQRLQPREVDDADRFYSKEWFTFFSLFSRVLSAGRQRLFNKTSIWKPRTCLQKSLVVKYNKNRLQRILTSPEHTLADEDIGTPFSTRRLLNFIPRALRKQTALSKHVIARKTHSIERWNGDSAGPAILTEHFWHRDIQLLGSHECNASKEALIDHLACKSSYLPYAHQRGQLSLHKRPLCRLTTFSASHSLGRIIRIFRSKLWETSIIAGLHSGFHVVFSALSTSRRAPYIRPSPTLQWSESTEQFGSLFLWQKPNSLEEFVGVSV